MTKIQTHFNYVDLIVGKLDPNLVKRTREYIHEKGHYVIGEGQGDLSSSNFVTPGRSNYSSYHDIYHLIDINSVVVLKQYWQKENPENFPTVTCSISGINKVLNDLFLENLVLHVVDSNKEKAKILEKLKQS